MRQTINISLPEKLKNEIEKAVEDGMYSSKSEFIRELLRMWKNKELIGHVKDIAKARREVNSKKVISQKELFKRLGI